MYVEELWSCLCVLAWSSSDMVEEWVVGVVVLLKLQDSGGMFSIRQPELRVALAVASVSCTDLVWLVGR